MSDDRTVRSMKVRNPLERMSIPMFGIGDLVTYRRGGLMPNPDALGPMVVEQIRTDGLEWAYACLWWNRGGGAHRFEFGERDLVPVEPE